MKKSRVAIIGAGPAGLAAAWALRDAPVEVTVFDKSRGVSGRAASRTRHGARFDFGANYFKLENPELQTLVAQALPSSNLIEIEGDVWTFDQAGSILPGDPQQNRQRKWNYNDGISSLGKALVSASGNSPRLQTRIVALERCGTAWRVKSDGADHVEEIPYDAILMTPPAPQTRELLANSQIDAATKAVLDQALCQAKYHKQWCFALGFSQPLTTRPPAFALINSDRKHDIAWLSFENDKPGRELGGSTVVMVQMSPDWSEAFFDESPEALIPSVESKVSELLGLGTVRPVWSDSHRWRYAHPYTSADLSALREAEVSGLYFAGDAWVGKGRVGETLQTGLDAARRITAGLS